MRVASSTKTILKITALSAVLGVGAVTLGGLGLPGDGAAWAQGQGQGQGGSDNQGGAGAGGQGGGGQGQGGPSGDSEGRGGPQSGGPSDGTGGKPVWAQEGLPEVELGRLSVARSPDHVLDRALAEALATWTPEMAAFYELSLDEMITELSLNWDNLTIYDSPLQNLALLKDVLADGTTQLDVDNTAGTLAALFLGVASDKTLTISTDTVIAVTTILGYPVTEASAADLAAAAEAIRIAVLAGHG
jgi:hypothetical protein